MTPMRIAGEYSRKQIKSRFSLSVVAVSYTHLESQIGQKVHEPFKQADTALCLTTRLGYQGNVLVLDTSFITSLGNSLCADNKKATGHPETDKDSRGLNLWVF